MNNIFRMIAVAAVLTPASALANSWDCTHNNLVRTVEIEYSETSATACEVNYTKASEGVEMQTLWNAENDTSYCEDKAEAFVAKLEGWGWACSQAEAEEAPATETEPAAEAPAQP